MESLEFSGATYLDFAVDDLDLFKQPKLSPIEVDSSNKLAKDILENLFQFRRLTNSHSICDLACPSVHRRSGTHFQDEIF